MNEVPLFRLYLLRAMYLFIVIGLGLYLWPGVLKPDKHWELMEGQATCMLAAFSLLCRGWNSLSAADVAGAALGSALENAVARTRRTPAMVVGACR